MTWLDYTVKLNSGIYHNKIRWLSGMHFSITISTLQLREIFFERKDLMIDYWIIFHLDLNNCIVFLLMYQLQISHVKFLKSSPTIFIYFSILNKLFWEILLRKQIRKKTLSTGSHLLFAHVTLLDCLFSANLLVIYPNHVHDLNLIPKIVSCK